MEKTDSYLVIENDVQFRLLKLHILAHITGLPNFIAFVLRVCYENRHLPHESTFIQTLILFFLILHRI